MTVLSYDCSADAGDYDAVRCYSKVIREARKQHECCECDDPILLGQKYEDTTGIDHYGHPFQFRTCIGCANLRRKYCPHGFVWGDLAEQIMDCLGFDYRTAPSDLDDDGSPSLYQET